MRLLKKLKLMNKEDKFQKKLLRVIKTIYYLDIPETLDKKMKRIEPDKDKLKVLLEYAKKKDYIIQVLVGKKGGSIVQIKEKGIEFLIENKKELRQNMINKTIALTGAVIALSSIYSFLEKTGLVKPWDITTIVIFFFMFFSFAFITLFLVKSFLGEI